MKQLRLLSLLFFLLLTACASYEATAPVGDINTRKVGNVLIHRVQKGETLYAIAWRYEIDYRKLARINNLSPPYAVYPGKDIKLNDTVSKDLAEETSTAHHKTVYVAAKQKSVKVVKRTEQSKKVASKEPQGVVRHWSWPTKGKVINRFSVNNKGIDIEGRYGQPIKATARGKVVYAGDGIRGYGNLLIIKHNSEYLTAYAHNNALLVREGDWVETNQKIAQMGKTIAGRPLLHFEMCRAGKPINPASYLS